MSVFITGDKHGSYRETTMSLGSKKFPEGRTLTKDDYLIVVGDFGWVWHNKDTQGYKKDQAGIEWLNDKPWTTLFVDGNHENHDMLNDLCVVDFCGGKAGKVSDSIYHLKRGEIFEIEGKKFFTFGGAMSTKTYNKRKQLEQIEGKNWWAKEIPSKEEFNYALNNLMNVDWKVDIVLSHTSPIEIVKKIIDKVDWYYEREHDPVALMLEHIKNNIEFKEWYFGHFHDNLVFDNKYFLLYENILQIV